MLSLVVMGVILSFFEISAREICCPNTGCFTNDAPFDDFLLPLPECASDANVKYIMYTRDNPDSGLYLTLNTVPPVFKGYRRTVFISHGYIANTELSWMTNIKNAFLKKEDINVVLIDWASGALTLYYPQAASNTRTVGAHTALVIQNLILKSGGTSDQFWCVGHSLGSHVCGHTGMRMPTSQLLGRVTGLDPAGPSFEGSPDLKIGLNPTSAKYVDVIHTDPKVLGTTRKLGHIDFYPTGYEYRIDLFTESVFSVGGICETVCMHHRSIDFFIDSLKGVDTCFAVSYQCQLETDLPNTCYTDETCIAYMGYHADRSCTKTGVHYLRVPPTSPFCQRL